LAAKRDVKIMRGQRIRQRKPALGAPWALLMVVLLAAVHPALQWTCYFAMPWPAEVHHSSQQSSQQSSPIHAPRPSHGPCQDSCRRPTESDGESDATHQLSHEAAGKSGHPHPVPHDGSCCVDSRDSNNFLRAVAARVSPPISSRDLVYPVFTLDAAQPLRLGVSAPIIHPPRDGTLLPLPSPFIPSSPGRAPPVVA
jgi:hypothetical protein